MSFLRRSLPGAAVAMLAVVALLSGCADSGESVALASTVPAAPLGLSRNATTRKAPVPRITSPARTAAINRKRGEPPDDGFAGRPALRLRAISLSSV